MSAFVKIVHLGFIYMCQSSMEVICEMAEA